MSKSGTCSEVVAAPSAQPTKHYTWNGRDALCGAQLDGRAYGPASMTVDCPDCISVQEAVQAERRAA
jgi:hypothetical protein